MTQQERSGLNEAAEISAHAAGAVRGAIKTGKMVSGAAKGAAVAGPYGAAAATLWTHRKAVAAIIAGLLVLPVLFIMLLPSLIFGGLTRQALRGIPTPPSSMTTPPLWRTSIRSRRRSAICWRKGRRMFAPVLMRILLPPVQTRRRSSIPMKALLPIMPTASLPCTAPPRIRTRGLA